MSQLIGPKLPKRLVEALDAADPRWEWKPGKRHYKLVVRGRLAGIWPYGNGNERSPNGLNNIIAGVRRAGQGVTSR